MNGAVGTATALAGLLAALLGIFKYFNYRSNRDQKAAVGEAFGAVVSGLSGTDSVERLASALLLRRFFSGSSEYAKPGMPYADDAIGVIAATLRDEPTGNVQKVLADGLAFVETAEAGRSSWLLRRRSSPIQGLRYRDLQRANFRNVYLSLEGPAGHRPNARPSPATAQQSSGGRRRHQSPAETETARPRLDLSGSDFFRSDLSYASLRNDVCVGTVFYECVAVRTVFRDSDLTKANLSGADVRHADFRNADLTEADFTGAKVSGANFDRAIVSGTIFKDATGLPAEFAARMGSDQRVSVPVGTEIVAESTNGDSGGVRVFLSVASVTVASQRPVIDLVAGVLRDEGFEVVRTSRDDYRHDRHLERVRQAMATCSGVIIIGLPQLLVEDGTWRQGTNDERVLKHEHLHTPWNDIETGLGIGLGLPVLAIRAGCGGYGVFGLASDDIGFEGVNMTERWETDLLVDRVRHWARLTLHG
jgi:uncharacterized protein YjbI with pentapeptide repeats